MLSPTNYHMPTHIAEGLALYHAGEASLEVVITDSELKATQVMLDEITDPRTRIEVGVGQVAGRTLLLADDHSRPMRELGVLR